MKINSWKTQNPVFTRLFHKTKDLKNKTEKKLKHQSGKKHSSHSASFQKSYCSCFEKPSYYKPL